MPLSQNYHKVTYLRKKHPCFGLQYANTLRFRDHMAPLAFFLAMGLLYFPPLFLCSAQGNNNRNSNPICPDFQCKNFGSFGFPFYNLDPRCGLSRLDCNQTVPRIQLSDKDQKWYNLTSLRNSSIIIQDKVFSERIRTKSSDTFHNLTFPTTSSISYYIYPPLTLFKCKNSPEVARITEKHFNNSTYHRYKGFREFNLYYKYPANIFDFSDRVDIPKECLIIQLPHLTQGMLPPGANHDLFQILTPNITLVLSISEDCLRCHYNGGQCQSESRNVLCIYVAKETRNRKVIITIGKTSYPLNIFTNREVTVALAIGIVVLVITVYTILKLTSVKYMVLSWKKGQKYQNIENFLKNYGSLARKRYSYSDVKKMTNSFKSKLGQGGYGHVYKGRLHNGNPVAVKILNESKGNGEDFINEVASISMTSHVNIVSFLGFCFEGNKRALVYEFVPNGSLEKFIYGGNSLNDRQLGWDKLYQIAIGIARGLEYLHRGCNTQILHFDIKPHNILLDEDFCPKIADFGLAKLCPGREGILSTMTTRGTIGYIAPEVFCRNFGGVSYKSDVYSYGMMVSEMVGGRKNIEVNSGINNSEIYFPHWIYKQLESGNHLGLHGIMNDGQNDIARKMIIVSLWCIQNDPLSRPSMTRVVEMLEGSLEPLQIPPKPYLSSPSRSPDSSSTIGLLS